MMSDFIISPNIEENYIKNTPQIDTTHYRLRSPIDLTFETVHPDDNEINIIVAITGPQYIFSHAIPVSHPQNPIHRKVLHSHDFFELMYVIKGEVYQNIEYKRHLYPQGSLCLMNKNIHHSEEFSTDFRCVFVMISSELINELFFPSVQYYFNELSLLKNNALYEFFTHNVTEYTTATREYIDFIPTSNSPEIYEKMYQLFDQLSSHFLNPTGGSTYAIKSILMDIFSTLLVHSSYSTVPINIGSDKELLLFDQIQNRMEKNKGRISRSELEKELNYSGSYLNSICKKYSGLNLFNYGMTICIRSACKMLLETPLSIYEISEELNFTNRSHFYKLFEKHIGMTPYEYRRRNH